MPQTGHNRPVPGLEGIFVNAGTVMVGSLCVLTLTGATISATAAYGWASLVAAAVQLRHLLRVGSISDGYALVKDSETSTSILTYVLGWASIVASLCLFAGNLIVWREAWPLLAAFSLLLTWGLFLFARLLTQRN